MQDDLAALKKGEAPAGFKIEKESEKEIKPITTEAQKGQEARKITPPPSISHVELGKLEKARPITAEPTPPRQTGLGAGQAQKMPIPPQLGIPRPSISIPSVGGILYRFRGRPDFKRIVFYVIAGLAGFIITAFLVPYFASFPDTSVSPTSTATPARTTTATPASIESMLQLSDPVRFSLSQDMTGKYGSYILINRLLPTGEPQIYRIADLNGKQYDFSEYTDGLNIDAPNELKALVENESLFITVFNKSDNKIGLGFIVRIKNPNQINETASVLKNWEGEMTRSLSNPFLFDSSKAASVGFLDNTYNGVTIRYRNFPDTGSTIDYAIFRAKNGESYLIMVNSREHIYKIIDKLK